MFIPDTGISMNDIQLTAENIKVSPINQNGLKIKGTEIYGDERFLCLFVIKFYY